MSEPDDSGAGNVRATTDNQFPAGQPFGGSTESGMGLEGAADMLDEYTRTRTITGTLDRRGLG